MYLNINTLYIYMTTYKYCTLMFSTIYENAVRTITTRPYSTIIGTLYRYQNDLI